MMRSPHTELEPFFQASLNSSGAGMETSTGNGLNGNQAPGFYPHGGRSYFPPGDADITERLANGPGSGWTLRAEKDPLPAADLHPEFSTPTLNGKEEGSILGPSTPSAAAPPENGSTPGDRGPSGDPGHSEPDPEDEDHGFLPVLRNFNFVALWCGQVFSQLADKVYLVLMIAIIASRFQGEDQTISGWVSSIMIAFTIPAVLFGSIAGVFVDRWSKKLVLVITNLLRGILVLALPSLLWISKGWSPLGDLPLGFCILLAITFLVSTLTQFFAPAEQAAIPLMVERRYLLPANSLYTTTMMASVIIGFAVGEPLLALADHLMRRLGGLDVGKEVLVGGAYAIAGLILLLCKTGEKTRTTDPETFHVWSDIRDGIRYLKQQQRVRGALIQLVVLFSIFASLAVLAVRLAEVMPALKSSQFGFLLAAGGVGMACGAGFLGYFGRRLGNHRRLNLYGSIGVAVALAGLGVFSMNLWMALLCLALVGGFAALIGIPMQTTIQAETPEEMRGKVFGLQNNAINIALSLPLALTGVAETFLGLKAVFWGLALIAIAAGLLTWYSADTGSNQPIQPDL